MRGSCQLATVRGIPIRLHLTLLVLLPVVFFQVRPSQWGWGLVAMALLFSCIVLHELGHSLAAIRRGYRVHDIVLLPIGGLARMERGPVRPGDELAIALAGPGVSLGLAAVLHILSRPLYASPVPVLGRLAALLAGANLMLALFNLLPSFPMDGGRVFRAWLTPFLGRLEATRRAAGLGRVMALVFGAWSLFRGNLVGVAIAVFVYAAAGAEYRMAIGEAGEGGSPGARAGPRVVSAGDPEVYVSPPPYARQARRRGLAGWVGGLREIFDDLLKRR